MTMTASHSAKAARPALPAGASPLTPLLMFWATFAVVVIVSASLDPALFVKQDPDSLMRIVEVRDLLAGQGWFDLVQHRLDPPGGALMHWSRLIDAPIAGLVWLGGQLGGGERFALIAWPLLLLLVLMAAIRSAATSLAGRDASLPALLLTLLFFSPLLMFTPGSIDHHNAQIALTISAFACVLSLERNAVAGLLAGCLASLVLAIGLEMLPALAVLCAAVALRWAATGAARRGTAMFGAALGVVPAALYLVTGSPQASMACDSLSWAYAIPAACGGFGLAALAALPPLPRPGRFAALAALATGTAGVLALIAPDCLGGPYGFLLPELKALFLDRVSEAEPLPVALAEDPAAILALVAPPCLALLVAMWRAWREPDARPDWLLAAVMLAMPLALSFYQVRTLPLANAAAIVVLGAWIAGTAARCGPVSLASPKASLPVLAAFVAAIPFTYLGIARMVDQGLLAATGERLPSRLANAAANPGLTPSEAICTDAGSTQLLASVPTGLVLSPVFYGSTVLAMSRHAVVAAPYHRAQQAILDSIHATRGPPEQGLAILRGRKVDYLAICSSDLTAVWTRRNAPNGLLARLLSGNSIAGLQSVPAIAPTRLRLWRVLPS